MKNSKEFQSRIFEQTVPPRYKNISWEKLQDVPKKTVDFIKNYAYIYPANEKESIYLHSKISGTGKSSLSVCLARDLIGGGKLSMYALYISYITLMDKLRQDKGAFTDSLLFKRILGADFIILDDIGVERLSKSVAERYYLILEYLWQYKKPAIFTSKYSIFELINRGDETVDEEILTSIGSRMVGMCEEIEIEEVEDYRNRR